VTITFLVTSGVVFFSCGMSTWFFNGDPDTAWTLWLMGLGFWVLAIGIFFYFLNDPYPKHRKDG
jgi:hypothetical protein